MNSSAGDELVNQETRVFLSLGSNLAVRDENLINALHRLSTSSIELRCVSNIYETEAVGVGQQPAYLNLACEIRSGFSASQLLVRLKQIQAEMGRIPTWEVEPRIIDMDLLFYGSLMQSSNHLTLPHPHLHERKFFLIPLVEIAPEFVDPVTHLKLSMVLASCPDTSRVEFFSRVTGHRCG